MATSEDYRDGAIVVGVGDTSIASSMIILVCDTLFLDVTPTDATIFDVGRRYAYSELIPEPLVVASIKEIFTHRHFHDYPMLMKYFIGRCRSPQNKPMTRHVIKMRPAMKDNRVNKRKSFLKSLTS